jgi:hypothetical protein
MIFEVSVLLAIAYKQSILAALKHIDSGGIFENLLVHPADTHAFHNNLNGAVNIIFNTKN